MKNFYKHLGIIALAAVTGFTMLACVSMPKGAEESTLAPDASNAVVYFIQPPMRSGAGDITIWDGENPVGKINGALDMNVAYRVRPGTHYFLANRFNWSYVRVEIRANTSYYIRLNWAPNPIPFADEFIMMELLTPNDGAEQLKRNEKTIAFTEDWRTEYKGGLSEKDLAELRENLSDARAGR